MSCLERDRTFLRTVIIGVSAIAALVALSVAADQAAPRPILPQALEWNSPPAVPGLSAAWVIGSESERGTYVLRVRLANDARIPPHTHPDERYTTVLSGTLYVGFGPTFDPDSVVAMPAGTVYVAPAAVPHYLWAKDGDVEYQEGGVGPTGTQFLDLANPRAALHSARARRPAAAQPGRT